MTPHCCDDFEAVWQAVLDRDLPPGRLAEAADCALCESRATLARHFLTPPTAEPNPIVPVAVLAEAARRDRAAHRRTLVAWLAVAASLMLSVGALTTTRSSPREIVSTPAVTPVRVADLFADTRASFGSWPRFQVVAPAPPRLPGGPEVPAELAGLPAAAKSGVEPITDSTRQALDYFRREAGLSLRVKS